MDNKILRTGMALLAAGLLSTACGGATDDSGHPAQGVTSSAHNDADVVFAQDMIGHHQQAITMAEMASRASNAEVRGLATRIQQAQAPEIQQMRGWLGQWGTGTSMAPMPGMDHGSMPGMMSDSDMQELARAHGAGFDRMFVQMMIKHHQGGVDMARTELADGANAEARTLANNIVTAQTAEISEMNTLLSKL